MKDHFKYILSMHIDATAHG